MNPVDATKAIVLVQPQAIVDNAEWVGSKGSTPVTVDTAGWGRVDILACLGANDIAVAELEVWECATSGGTYTLVDGAEFGATGLAALPSATDDNKIFHFGIDTQKTKRYIQLFAKNGDGTSGGYVCAVALLSKPSIIPDSDAERGYAASVIV